MNDQQKKTLLKVAKDSLTAVLTGRAVSVQTSYDTELNEQFGCFVTYKNNEQLRGCIGHFTSDEPLIELVSEMAATSATQDPRFQNDRITEGELPQIDIEISALTPLKKTDDPLTLRLGIDGIYIVKGYKTGCLLPQVATETGWSAEEFLSYCSEHKAGLGPDAWKDGETEVYLFSADVFGAGFDEI
jgi:AmmeMemoRadiSam system protein A